MPKVAVIVLADTETHADMGRVTNAIEVVKEFRDAGDESTLIFDGAGTKWVGVLADPQHRMHQRFLAVRPSIAGACRFCAAAFGAREDIERSGIPLLGDFEGHPSIRSLIAAGYQVITF
ncbi:MAG TPA: hypothetical protein VF818_10925 [Ktedonobacterales bacterium]